MLPKIFRLHQDKEIKDLVKNGQSFFLPQLVIKYKKNQTGPSRFAFVVSTKVDKRAVIRNRLQRQMREIVRSNLDKIKPGYSVLIIAKKSALELDFTTLSQQIDFAFNKIKIYQSGKNDKKANSKIN